jgi:hypothetical protein
VNSLRCRCFLQFTTCGHPCYNPPYLWTVSDAGSSQPGSVFTSIYFILEWGAVLLKRSQKLRARKRGGGRWAEDDGEAYVLLSLSLQPSYRSEVIVLTKQFTDRHERQCAFKMRSKKKKSALYVISPEVLKLKTSCK